MSPQELDRLLTVLIDLNEGCTEEERENALEAVREIKAEIAKLTRERDRYRAALVGLVETEDPKELAVMLGFLLASCPARVAEHNAVRALLGDEK